MSTISFIERFKKHEDKKAENQVAESTKLLRIIQSINQITDSTPMEEILANAIFHSFSPSVILLSTASPTALHVKKAWISAKLAKSQKIDTLVNKPSSELCESVRKNKNIQMVAKFPEEISTDPLLKQLGTKSYAGFPVFNEENQVIAVLSLINASTNFSKTECDALKSLAERINHEAQISKNTTFAEPNAVSTPTDSQLQSELDTANQCLESISYTISHDLRAPLRSIDSFSSILAEDFSDQLPEDAMDSLARIRRSTKRMGSLIDDLLWLAKVTRRNLAIQEMDLSKAANKLLAEILENHKEYNCEFQSEPHLLVEADKYLMKIVLKNLLDNACKFSQHQEKIQISLNCLQQNNQKVYQLSDNGCGFDMAYSDQLFEPFKRLHEGREFKGTGIGLATAKRIIQRHRGKIWIESEPNEGTSVFFTLGTELN